MMFDWKGVIKMLNLLTERKAASIEITRRLPDECIIADIIV